MAKYTLENTSKIGKPCRIFDAGGEEVQFVLSCNTENGEVERLNHDGVDFVLNSTREEIERIQETRAFPLRVEWKKMQNS